MGREREGPFSEASPINGYYRGTVKTRRTAWMVRVVESCHHNHRTAETAARCGERMLRKYPLGRPTKENRCTR